MRARLFAIAWGFLAVGLLSCPVTGCGGSTASGPSPLRHTIEDRFLAAVPPTEQTAILEAKKELDLAGMERAKAEADLEDSDTKLNIAHNEAGQAKLAQKSAQAEKLAADKSADLTRKNNADREERTAELGCRAADAKVEFLKAKQKWLQKQVGLTRYREVAKEAKWQLEKARLASAKNIQPEGFVLGNFQDQAADRADVLQRQQSSVDQVKQVADEKQKVWESAKQEYLAAKGPQTPASTTTSTDNKAPIK